MRRRSAPELATRALQVAVALTERVGLSPDVWEPAGTDRWVGIEAIPGLEDRAATVDLAWRRWPDAASALVAIASDASAGRFTLLGLRGLSYGDPIDWHFDPTSGRRAPLHHWSRVPFLDEAVVGDHKVI